MVGSLDHLARLCLHALGGFAPALHPETAQRGHGLRRETQVGADGNAALDQKTHRLCGPAAAFEFDHMGACLHQSCGRSQGLFAAFVIAAIGQVANQEGGALATNQATRDRFHMVDHGFQRYARGAVEALADHA